MRILMFMARSFEMVTDGLAIGLRHHLGGDFVDFPRKAYLYDDGEPLASTVFTLMCVMDSSVEVERDVCGGGFDYVIWDYTEVLRPSSVESRVMWDMVDPSRRIVIDGHDGQEPVGHDRGSCLFYKRENVGLGRPISISIPAIKVADSVSDNKIYKLAPYFPGQGYFTDSEAEYYGLYRQSELAITCRKGGWDCLRHYEIMSQGCVPVFLDVERCPEKTCTTLPKSLLVKVNRRPWSVSESLAGEMLSWCRERCTCESVARSFLEGL